MPEINVRSNHFSQKCASRRDRDNLIFEIEMRAFHSLLRFLPKPRLAMGMGTVGLVRALDSRGIGVERNLPKLTRARKVPAILTLCQAPSPALFLKECHHLLRPEGRIFIGFIPRESPWGRFYAQTQKRGRSIPRLAGVYSLKKVEHMMMDAGFSIQGYFSTLFQKPGGVRDIENPMKGYLPQAGFLIIMGERMN
jgi:hypothetical protein